MHPVAGNGHPFRRTRQWPWHLAGTPAATSPLPIVETLFLDGSNRPMTEQEWLSSSDPERMVDYVNLRGARDRDELLQWYTSRTRASHRKLRLFACACCRRISRLLSRRAQKTLDLTEAVADELLPDIERANALRHLAAQSLGVGKRDSRTILKRCLNMRSSALPIVPRESVHGVVPNLPPWHCP